MRAFVSALAAACVGGLAAAALAATPAAAAGTQDFYKGKDITLIVSAGPGGGYSAYGRLLSRHMTRHIPGEPDLIVKNMPGGGGLRATNFLFSSAPGDGTVLGLVHTAVVFAPLYELKGARFDGRKFHFIGAMDSAPGMCVAWAGSGIRTWQDLFDKTFVVGGTGAGSQMETMPRLVNALFGTHIKIISGYKGGNDVYLAMERGEVQGRCGGLETSIKATRPDWFPQKKVVVPIQVSLTRNPDFPDVPTVMEFARDDRTRDIFEFALAYQDMDRPVLAPPDVPADRVDLLRAAFAATVRDPAFLRDAEKQRLTVDSRSGESVQKLVARSYAKPKDIIDAAAEAMSPHRR